MIGFFLWIDSDSGVRVQSESTPPPVGSTFSFNDREVEVIKHTHNVFTANSGVRHHLDVICIEVES